jgi:hypothetical protein
MSELPDNIKRIDVLRLEKAKQKPCECHTYHYDIDNANKLVYCRDCGAIVDPFQALWNLAYHYECLGDQVNSLLEQRKEIVNWKPWLLVFRKLESSYRSKENLPCCPECGKPFYFEQIRNWTNRKMEEIRREREKKEVK